MTYPLKNGRSDPGPYDRFGGRKDPGRGGGREGRGGRFGGRDSRETPGGRPRSGPPTAAGTRERLGTSEQPIGPLEESQVNLLSFYNSITTDDEFREVFGVFDPADIETLRRNPNMLAAASPYWWDRLQVFHNDVESGKRTLDIQRRMRRYEQAEADGRLITPRAKPVDIPDVQANFAGATPAMPADTRRTIAEDLTDVSQEGADYIPGNYSPRADKFTAEGGLSSTMNLLTPTQPLNEAIRRFAGGDTPGQERLAPWKRGEGARDIEAFKTIGRGLLEGELPLSLPTQPQERAPGDVQPWVKDLPVVGKGVGWLQEHNPREWLQEHAPLLVDTADNPTNIYSIPIMEELFKSGERSKPEGLTQVQRELYELSAAYNEAPFLQQMGADVLNVAGPVSAGAFALKGFGRGALLATRKIPFSQLGEIAFARLPATGDTLASHTSRGIGRIGGLPGIRLLTRPLAGKSVEFNQHIEGSAEEALARSPTLWHSMLEMGQRFSAVILAKGRAQGDWGKVFGLVKKNGLPTNRMTKIKGSPFSGDILELADLDMADEILEFGTRYYIEDVTETVGRKTAKDIDFDTWPWRYRAANREITEQMAEAGEFGEDIAPELLKKLDEAAEALRVEGQKLGHDQDYIHSVAQDAFGYTEADIAKGLTAARLGAEGVKVTRQVDKVRRIMPTDNTGAHPEWAEVDRLSREQIDMIRFIRTAYQDALKMMREEGVDVKALGEFMDGFHYVARKVGRDWKMVPARSGGPGLMKGRTIDPDTGFVKTMGQQISQGNRYLDPLETLSLYMDEMYRLIAKKRLTEYLRPFSREQEVEKIVKTRASMTGKQLINVRKSVDVVKRVLYHGGGTHHMTRAMMRRAFPSLANDIDAALSFKGVSPEAAVKDVTDAMLDKNMATWPIFRKELKSLIGRTPRMIERNDVKAVVETLSKDVDRQVRLTNDVYQAIYKGVQKNKETQLKQLLDRMETLRPMSEKAAKAAEKALKDRGDDLGQPFKEEAATTRLPGLIFGEVEELGRIRGVKNPQEFATSLEGMLDDMGLKRFGVMDKLVKFNDAVRWMKTTWDFGHTMIQGLPLLARDPEAWGKSVGLSMRAFADDGVRASYVAKNADSITRMIQYGGHIGSTEFTDTMASGGWFAKFPHVMQSMPGPAFVGNGAAGSARMITRLAGRFQESFEVFLDVGRIETWQALEGVAMRSKSPEKALYELGSFVNKLTGTTSSAALGIGATQRQMESTFFMFSPRYTRATLALISDMVRGGLRGNEARIAVGRLMAGQVMMHNAGAIALGQEPNLVPGRGDFLKWEINGQYVGFGGKFNALLNLSMDLFEQLRDNPEGLITKDIFSSDSYDNSALLRRLRYQTSVLTGTFLDFMTETSPIGKRFRDPDDERDLGFYSRNIPLALVERFGPFYIDGVNEALGGFVEPGPKAAITGGLAEAIGLSSFPIQAREMRDRKREDLAQEFYGMSVDKVRENINYGEMLAKIDTQPEMVKLMEASDKEARQFARNDERFEIQDERTNIDDRFVRALEDVSRDFGAGRFGNKSGEVLRGVWKTALRDRRVSLEQLRSDHKEYFEDVDDYYREMADRNPTMAATAEFMDRAFVEENFDSQGRPDYIRFDAIKADLVEKYGAEAVEASEVNARLRLKQLGLPEPIQDLMKAWETLRPYWDTYKEVLPERDWAMWRIYDSATDVEKTSMETSTKFDFRRWALEVNYARKVKQNENYDMDEALMIFYDRRPLNNDLLYTYMRRGQR